MADYIDGTSSDKAGVSRRSLIKKGMMAGGVGLWAVPVLAVVTRNGSSEGGSGVAQNITPANHGGPAVTSCGVQGSGPGCITFVCTSPFTFTECVGTPPTPVGGAVTNGPNVCFCDTDITGTCRCFANDDCADLVNCTSNAGCPAGTFCVNPFSCCGVGKCARVCT